MLGGLFIATGCFLIIVASIGVVRFPDFYSRMHPAGKIDTLGQMLILMGLMVYEGFTPLSIKLSLIILFIFVVNPTSTHFVAQAAYLAHLKPYEKKKSDQK